MLYNIIHKINRLLFKLFFRLKVKGVKNIPPEGGVLVCSNHLSNLDPVILGTALPRSAHYLAKGGLFRNPLFGRFLTLMHAFPIHREGFPRQAFKIAQSLLSRNEILILYPEGTRSRNGKLGPAKGGVGMLVAGIGNIPVIPAKIIGTNKALPPGGLFIRPCPIEVRFGKPLHFEVPSHPSKETYREIARTIMAAIGEL